jgi:hypothetical protein
MEESERPDAEAIPECRRWHGRTDGGQLTAIVKAATRGKRVDFVALSSSLGATMGSKTAGKPRQPSQICPESLNQVVVTKAEPSSAPAFQPSRQKNSADDGEPSGISERRWEFDEHFCAGPYEISDISRTELSSFVF